MVEKLRLIKKIKLFTIGELRPEGAFIYSENVANYVINELVNKQLKEINSYFVTIEDDVTELIERNTFLEIDLSKIVGNITNCYLEDNTVYFDLEILDTPCRDKFLRAIDLGKGFFGLIGGIADLTHDKTKDVWIVNKVDSARIIYYNK